MQNKFQVPRSHSIGEKCNANYKITSHFSQKLCDRGKGKFFFQKVSIWVDMQNRFQVPRSHSIGEKREANL